MLVYIPLLLGGLSLDKLQSREVQMSQVDLDQH